LTGFYLTCFGCGLPVRYESSWLDAPAVNSSALTDPSYLVSTRIPSPNEETLAKPVFITIHGFSATPFEWSEFKSFAENKGALVSAVLLGGHGRDLTDFKKSTWQDWQKPIIIEYTALVQKGYKNINFVATSAGATLLLELLENQTFKPLQAPHTIVLVDPIILHRSKYFKYSPFLSILIKNLPPDKNRSEIKQQNWYNNTPSHAIVELYRLTSHVKQQLEKPLILPVNTTMIVYHSKNDPVIDPISSMLIFQGIQGAHHEKIKLQYVDSNLHVFTQLCARDHVTADQRQLQQRVFQEIMTNACSTNR